MGVEVSPEIALKHAKTTKAVMNAPPKGHKLFTLM
jgi:hypothetical protein